MNSKIRRILTFGSFHCKVLIPSLFKKTFPGLLFITTETPSVAELRHRTFDGLCLLIFINERLLSKGFCPR